MVSVKTVVVGPEKTGPSRTVLAGPEVAARTVVVGTFPDFLFTRLGIQNIFDTIIELCKL